MNGGLGTMDDLSSLGEAEWWYRVAGGTSGPVSAAELRRLSSAGPLDADTPVWTKAFGGHWRRLVDAMPTAADRLSISASLARIA